ncbi:hypothetical protein D3C76_1878450 [compost metagenome]
MMNPVPWLQMTNMISYQGLVRTFPKDLFIKILMDDVLTSQLTDFYYESVAKDEVENH